ncbi:MAG: hypothetical protein IT428_06320 [Planctomycetaceae bacterium]|nr:hypothetical protein [Planctomycetaceae bacterium]
MAKIIRRGLPDAIEKLDGLHAISINEQLERLKEAAQLAQHKPGRHPGCVDYRTGRRRLPEASLCDFESD